MTTAWTCEHVRGIAGQAVARLPELAPDRFARPRPDLYYWDMWPVQDCDGRIARIADRELWMVLCAPDNGDPAARHFAAKIHLLRRDGDRWSDLGPALPEFSGPYEREWSGSAIWADGQFTLWFTGAGLSARPGGYQQALFETTARTDGEGLPEGWTEPKHILADPFPEYLAADAHEGEAGRIKAYRDPAYFRDPADGREYLAFTASRAWSDSEYTGAIGLAVRNGGDWRLLPAPIHSGGVNNELERAHIVYRDGAYLAFWATQSSTFATALREAPTGLYGMVADSVTGPYRPLNGTGLVLANPAGLPCREYSWSVTRELVVSSFVDRPDPDCREFVGAPAPLSRLDVDPVSARAIPFGWLEDAAHRGVIE